ncbi:hypothetical protein FQA39_LY04437 [Lamprigera yunnana]|nr:hypothetical protein FQA39_LY04437 [Lamprigera yunnana]
MSSSFVRGSKVHANGPAFATSQNDNELFLPMIVDDKTWCHYFNPFKTTTPTSTEISGAISFGKNYEFCSIKKGLDTSIVFFNKTRTYFKSLVKAIFPGTLWCGDGNAAGNFDELGLFRSTDACCREHDHCNDTITSHTSKHGLTNTGLFTRIKRSHRSGNYDIGISQFGTFLLDELMITLMLITVVLQPMYGGYMNADVLAPITDVFFSLLRFLCY